MRQRFFILFFLIFTCCFNCTKNNNLLVNNYTIIDFAENEYKDFKTEFNNILNNFVGSKVDVLYSVLGQPDEKQTIEKRNIQKVIYSYLYDFEKNNYDCNVEFVVDKNNKITEYNISSNICYTIIMY